MLLCLSRLIRRRLLSSGSSVGLRIVCAGGFGGVCFLVVFDLVLVL